MSAKTKITKKNEVKAWLGMWLLRDTYEYLKEAAVENNRTLSGEINFRLKQSVPQNPKTIFAAKSKKNNNEISEKFKKKQPGDKGYVPPEKEGIFDMSHAVNESEDVPEYKCPNCNHTRGYDGNLCVNILKDGWECERCLARGDKKDLKF